MNYIRRHKKLAIAIFMFVLTGGLGTAFATMKGLNPFLLKSEFSEFMEVGGDEIYWQKWRHVRELERETRGLKVNTKERERSEEATAKEKVKLERLKQLKQKHQRGDRR